jgi:DNA-binding transcriptional MerR regulator
MKRRAEREGNIGRKRNNMKKSSDDRLGTVEATQNLDISPERLRYWERLGIVNPEHVQHGTRKFRRYSKEDIDRATLVKTLVDCERYTLEGAIKKLKEK